jgi:polyvinyl alcohol dehydrogenase (cytochrome)
MRAQAQTLNDSERRNLSVFLGQANTKIPAAPDPQANKCLTSASLLPPALSDWASWGHDVGNTRYQQSPGFSARDVPRLRLKWTFAYPGGIASTNPVVMGSRVYVGSLTGQVFALDAKTGCTYWSINVGALVRAAVTVSATATGVAPQATVYIADYQGTVHAADAGDGRLLWSTKLIDDPTLTRISGSPTLWGHRLYVPITGYDGVGASPDYPCCKGRGALIALDAFSGAVLWKRETIKEMLRPTGTNAVGVQSFGPSGAGIWTAPTIDPKRQLIYVTTGNDYSSPGSDSSDAVLAYRMADGRQEWKSQVVKKDIWDLGCMAKPPVNCPPNPGRDLDFASPPILQNLSDGREIILAGAKSGIVYAFDARNRGRILWRTQLSDGDNLGAIMFGSAADPKALYVALSNPKSDNPSQKPGGMAALDIATGRRIWTAPSVGPDCSWGKDACLAAQMAPLAVMDGIVFSGSTDGHIRSYSTSDGSVNWDFDTAQAYQAVNGVEARGGGIGRGGATIAAGTLYVNSGDGYGQTGNVLIAFTVDGR